MTNEPTNWALASASTEQVRNYGSEQFANPVIGGTYTVTPAQVQTPQTLVYEREESYSFGSNLISLVMGIFLIASTISAIIYFSFTLAESIILSLASIIMYVVLLYFLLEPSIKNVTLQKPVVREIVELSKAQEIEKPAAVEVQKNVYIERKRKKLNIPKYNYLGSTQTKTFHTRNCRLGKLIKKKYKLSSNYTSFFKVKRFKGCKVCIKKTKKI